MEARTNTMLETAADNQALAAVLELSLESVEQAQVVFNRLAASTEGSLEALVSALVYATETGGEETLTPDAARQLGEGGPVTTLAELLRRRPLTRDRFGALVRGLRELPSVSTSEIFAESRALVSLSAVSPSTVGALLGAIAESIGGAGAVSLVFGAGSPALDLRASEPAGLERALVAASRFGLVGLRSPGLVGALPPSLPLGTVDVAGLAVAVPFFAGSSFFPVDPAGKEKEVALTCGQSVFLATGTGMGDSGLTRRRRFGSRRLAEAMAMLRAFDSAHASLARLNVRCPSDCTLHVEVNLGRTVFKEVPRLSLDLTLYSTAFFYVSLAEVPWDLKVLCVKEPVGTGKAAGRAGGPVGLVSCGTTVTAAGSGFARPASDRPLTEGEVQGQMQKVKEEALADARAGVRQALGVSGNVSLMQGGNLGDDVPRCPPVSCPKRKVRITFGPPRVSVTRAKLFGALGGGGFFLSASVPWRVDVTCAGRRT